MAWKTIDSLSFVPSLLFSDIYLSLLLNFKIWSLLALSCLMSSIFIIILIIRIIKTTCFNNTILMAELKGKLSQSRWFLSAHNFPNSGYFHKIFGMHLKKRSVHLYIKRFLPRLLNFSIYKPSPNGQIISLIGAQPHL